MISAAVLDYDSGNVRSITNALRHTGAQPLLTRERRILQAADALVIPGVGAFGNAMESLRKYRLIEAIRRFAASGKPILGICLGMQLLFDQSEEFGLHAGLGLIPGAVKRLPVKEDVRLPHIAWNGVYFPAGLCREETLFRRLEEGTQVYFVHTYAAVPASRDCVIGLSRYGGCEFVSAVQAGRIMGCQFHPEKSRQAGLALFEEFLRMAKDENNDRDRIESVERNADLLRAAGPGSVL